MQQQDWRDLNEDIERVGLLVDDVNSGRRRRSSVTGGLSPRCIIPQLSLFIQLDKQIIRSFLFIATIIHHRAGRQKKSLPPKATAFFLTLTQSQARVGG